MLLEYSRVAHRIEVGLHDCRSVQYHGDQSAFGGNLFTIPFARRFLESLFCGNYIVDRSMILGGPELALVARRSVVEDLDLHSGVGGIPRQRGMPPTPEWR